MNGEEASMCTAGKSAAMLCVFYSLTLGMVLFSVCLCSS